tara:strand:- start:7613 stop:9205 length:1593 start_codon:yes stop_codon:yes gene_type:complete
MELENILKNKSFLYLEINFSKVSLHIFKKVENVLEVIECFEVNSIDTRWAVEECFDSLQKKVKKFPKNIVLSSMEHNAGWLNIDIPKNLDQDQLQSMIRWEMDGAWDYLGTAPSLEQFLEKSDFLKKQDRLLLMDEAIESGLGVVEIAKQKKLLSPKQEELFHYKIDQWPSESEDYKVNFAKPSRNFPKGYSYISYIPERMYLEWLEFFTQKKLNLLALIPLKFADYNLFALSDKDNSPVALIETDLFEIHCTFFKSGNIIEQVSYPCIKEEIPLSLLQDICMHEVQWIHSRSNWLQWSDITKNLKRIEEQDREIQELVLDSKKSSLVSIESVLLDQAESKHQYPIPILEVIHEPQPIYNNVFFYLTLGFLFYALFCFLSPVETWKKHQDLSEEKSRLEKSYDSLKLDQKEKTLALKKEKELQREIKKLKRQTEGKLVVFNQNHRVDFYASTLHKISKSIQKEIALDHIKIDASANLSISGNSITDTAVHKMIQNFYDEMGDWDLNEQELILKLAQGNGTSYHFSLIPKR